MWSLCLNLGRLVTVVKAASRLPRIGHKRQRSFCLLLLGHSPLDPSCHAVRKPSRLHGKVTCWFPSWESRLLELNCYAMRKPVLSSHKGRLHREAMCVCSSQQSSRDPRAPTTRHVNEHAVRVFLCPAVKSPLAFESLLLKLRHPEIDTTNSHIALPETPTSRIIKWLFYTTWIWVVCYTAIETRMATQYSWII